MPCQDEVTFNLTACAGTGQDTEMDVVERLKESALDGEAGD